MSNAGSIHFYLRGRITSGKQRALAGLQPLCSRRVPGPDESADKGVAGAR